jgi:hypothetical protein
MTRIRSGISWAGLIAGPGAWAVSTQLNYALADWSCRHEPRLVPVAALVLALAALAGAFLSARAWRASGAEQSRLESDGAPHRFLAGMSLMLAVLFAIVIMTQGSAAFLLNGCER